MKLRVTIVGLIAVMIWACSDQGPTASGATRVVLSTVGLDLDADGYTVTIDARSQQPASINGTVQFDSLAPGSHSVGLGDLASNCAVSGANPLSVDVVAENTAEVTFAVVCTVRFVAVSAGSGHTCATTTRGSAYCWGDNSYGELGDGITDGIRSEIPVKVLGGLTFAAVIAGPGHTCGLTTDGKAYCWGHDGGALGDDTTTAPEQCGFAHIRCRPVPVAVLGGLAFVTTSLGGGGGFHTCGVTTAREAYCWGSNGFGQLGSGGDTAIQHTSPIAVVGGLTFTSVSAGGLHTCGVTAGGQAYCWGTNYFGQLGNGASETTEQASPVAVVGGLTFATISAGSEHTCGLTTEGVAYCWGYAYAVGRRPIPLAVDGGFTFDALSAGGNHTCGLTRNGLLFCWGSNSAGELGDGTTGDYRSTPVKVFGQP